MKKMILFCFAMLAVFLIANLGFAMGCLASLLSALVVFLIWHRIDYIQTIAHYAKQYENIYVVSNHPDTDDEVFIQEVDHLIVNASYTDVMREVKDQERWLSESKNAFFCDPALKDHQRLQVIPIIYQDGQFVNESFKQFRKRVIEEIKKDRAERHAMLKKTDAAWYHKYSNNQRSVEWTKSVQKK